MNDPMPLATSFSVVRDGDPAALYGAVVAIGNFDGVHRGHRTVIDAARARAAGLGRKAAALTFSPHPRRFFQPAAPLFNLSSERDRLRLLAATGLDGAIVMHFDAELAATSAQDFIERILVGRFGKMHGDVPAAARLLEGGNRGLAFEEDFGKDVDNAFGSLLVADGKAGAIAAGSKGGGAHPGCLTQLAAKETSDGRRTAV